MNGSALVFVHGMLFLAKINGTSGPLLSYFSDAKMVRLINSTRLHHCFRKKEG